MRDSLIGGKSIISWGVIVCFLFAGSIGDSYSKEGTSDEKKYYITKTDEKKKPSEDFESSYPEESKSGTTSKQLMILGGAVAIGIGALAVAGSSSGGGGGSDEPACELDPVGPSIAGDNWAGRLRLINYGSQDVVANVTQCGSRITITTNTALHHGKSFSGSISSNGYIHVSDNTTFQIWTTFKGNASSTSLRIYDYVNNATQLDSLELAR